MVDVIEQRSDSGGVWKGVVHLQQVRGRRIIWIAASWALVGAGERIPLKENMKLSILILRRGSPLRNSHAATTQHHNINGPFWAQ